MSINLRMKEQWLREEIRDARIMIIGLQRWGVTLLAAIESSLYYLRRDVSIRLIKAGAMREGQLLPFFRWFLGTLLLVIVAGIFGYLTYYIIRRLRNYRKQLLEMVPSYSGIKELELGGFNIKHMHIFLFFLVPLFDLMIYGLLSLETGGEFTLKIPW